MAQGLAHLPKLKQLEELDLSECSRSPMMRPLRWVSWLL